jgi:FAD/FMN-containing dehydrogenase
MNRQVLTPGDPGYDEHRRSFNGMLDRRPAEIALVESIDDVVEALAGARDRGLSIGVRGGGHSVAGHGLVDDGVVIDLRRMRGVNVPGRFELARVQGGATWEDFDTAAQAKGLAVTGGTFVDTGVAGLTLGGGIGFLLGTHGLTCDNLAAAELVTAAGDVLEVDTDSDPELLWALRGGGGNFGIATRLDFVVNPVGRLFGADPMVELGDGSVIRRMAEVQRDAPDGFVCIAYVANRQQFGPSVNPTMVSSETEIATRRLHDEILAPGEVIEPDFGPITYAQAQGYAGILPFGLRHYWKSAFVPELSDEVVDEIVELVRGRPVGKSGFLLEPIHGAARRFGFDHAAFPQRTARWHVSALGIWEDAADDDMEIGWVRESHRRITALGTTGTYVNYIAPDEPVDRASSTWPPDVLARLRAVKRRLDPENVFRSNLNITPS